MSGKLKLYTTIAAFGGFLIGFSIAGLLVTKPLFFEYFQIKETIESLVIFSGIPGFLIGLIAIGRVADKLGRRFMLIILGFLFLASAIGNGLAINIAMFIIFQFISGLAIGAISVLSPLYISEISPAKYKVRSISLFLLLSLIGMLLGLSAQFLMNIGINNWRWIFLGELYLHFCLLYPCFL